MRCSTGSQCTGCSSCSSELAWDRRGAWLTILAALFCTRCSFWMVPRMDRRIAQSCSSRFWRESGYMQASVLGPVLADDVCGGSLVHDNCTIAPQLTRGCRMSGDGQEWRRGLSCCPPRAGRHQQQITTSDGMPLVAGWPFPWEVPLICQGLAGVRSSCMYHCLTAVVHAARTDKPSSIHPSTYFRCGGIYYVGFVYNLLPFPTVKEFWKSVRFWQSYHHELQWVMHFFETLTGTRVL